MKISVIVPIYNTEKYLSECIESILSQTLQDIELILVNDGSPDNCDAICKKYAASDKRVKYIHQKNQGVSVARNTGMAEAQGEYLFFMDSDDTIDEKFLETSYFSAQQHNADLVVIGKYFCYRALNSIPALPVWAFIVKRKLLNENPDIIFPVGLQPCEDGLFSHQLLALTNNLTKNPDGIYNYRAHDGQNHTVINTACEKVLNQIPIWFNILDAFYTSHHLYETKSSHLARFVEHEPFYFRFCSMPFTEEQRCHLIDIIRDFIYKKVQPYLSAKDYKSLHWSFRYIMKSHNIKLLRFAFNLQHVWYKFLLLLVNIIPYKSSRKKLRHKISECCLNLIGLK